MVTSSQQKYQNKLITFYIEKKKQNSKKVQREMILENDTRKIQSLLGIF